MRSDRTPHPERNGGTGLRHCVPDHQGCDHGALMKSKLTKGQQMMIEDGAPTSLFIDAEERRKAWEKIPLPRKLSGREISNYSRYKDPEAERLARLEEIDRARTKAARDAERFPTLPKKPKVEKAPFGTGLFIKSVQNTRKPGTGSYQRVEALIKYLKKNPNAEVADVLANTPYRKDDYNWDFERGNIKVDTNKPKGAK